MKKKRVVFSFEQEVPIPENATSERPWKWVRVKGKDGNTVLIPDVKSFFGRLAASVGLIVLFSLAGCTAAIHKPQGMVRGVPNFAVVIEGKVYRSAEPTPEGWTNLWKLGVRKVVKLNTASEGDDATARALGMTVCEFPISTEAQIFGPVDDKLVRAAVAAIGPEPTIVHCGSTARTDSRINALIGNQGGQDRTWLIIACYMVQQGQPKAYARKEMIRMGFHPILHGLNEYFENFKPAP